MSSNRRVSSSRTSLQNLARDRFELAPHPGVLEHDEALVTVERTGRALSAAFALAVQDVALQPPEQGRCGCGRVVERVDEAVVVVESGSGVESAHVLASRAAPEVKGGGVARVHVLPEALAGAERVDDDVDRAADAFEELVKAACDVREAEEVHSGERQGRTEVQACDGLVKGHNALTAAARARLSKPAFTEHRHVEPPLPALRLRVPFVERAPGLPCGEHVDARVRVLLEQPADPRGELHAPQVDDVGGVAARAEIRPHRRELGMGEKPLVEEERE